MDSIKDSQRLLLVVQKIHRIYDYGMLLESILHEIRKFLNAEAATFFLKNEDKLFFYYIENEVLFPGGEGIDKFSYSRQSIAMDKTSLAGYAAVTGESVLVDDVYQMPPEYEFQFNRDFDKKNDYRTKSALVIPIKTPQNRVFGAIQLLNAKKDGKIVSFTPTDRDHAVFLSANAVYALEKAEVVREMVFRMVRIVELRDPEETGQHARRVGEYSMLLYDKYAQNRGISLAERSIKKEAFRTAAILHDVGKAGVSESILRKNKDLSQEEKSIKYSHTVYGARLFPDPHSFWDRIAREVVLNHHERWDGSGYPGHIEDIDKDPIEFGHGKQGPEIPLSARIVAICDVYDALTSARSYKDSWSLETAFQYLKSKSGKFFDPELTVLFFELKEQLRAVAETYAD